uniref:Uncharacterized protein n=1 Tax=Pyricularia oryzae (strain P131) TaxID=1143193 RepID=L7IS50_PYRO1
MTPCLLTTSPGIELQVRPLVRYNFNFSNTTITLLLPVRHLLYAYILPGPDRKDKGNEPPRKAREMGSYAHISS